MRLTCFRSTRNPLADGCGQTITEYAIIVSGLAVLILLGVIVFAGHLSAAFHKSSPDAPVLRPPQETACDPDYSGACIPSPPPYLDCAELRALGITGKIRVVGSDPQHLDPDGDGIACD
jgi:Flp pilus assembly pilin Flp